MLTRTKILYLSVSSAIIMAFLGCETSVSESKNQHEKSVNGDLFLSEQLNQILDDYVKFLRNQKDEELHNQLVRIDFYLDKKDTVVSFGTGKYLSVSIDKSYDWILQGKVGNNNIFISDHKTHVFGSQFYNRNVLKVVKNSNDYYPNEMYDEIKFENDLWIYRIEGDELFSINR